MPRRSAGRAEDVATSLATSRPALFQRRALPLNASPDFLQRGVFAHGCTLLKCFPCWRCPSHLFSVIQIRRGRISRLISPCYLSRHSPWGADRGSVVKTSDAKGAMFPQRMAGPEHGVSRRTTLPTPCASISNHKNVEGVQCRPGGRPSIVDRLPLHVIDYKHCQRALLHFQLQPELLHHRVEER